MIHFGKQTDTDRLTVGRQCGEHMLQQKGTGALALVHRRRLTHSMQQPLNDRLQHISSVLSSPSLSYRSYSTPSATPRLLLGVCVNVR